MNSTDIQLSWVKQALPSYFLETEIPAILSEWAALIPLIVHLASSKGDHALVGELALAGRLTLSIFPKLGHLNGISRLLSGIPDFLDRASSKGDLSSTVWDVVWGSSFPCANGSAREYLTRYALRNNRDPIDLEAELSPIHSDDTEAVKDAADNNGTQLHQLSSTTPRTIPSHLRRYQTLHVIQVGRDGRSKQPKWKQWRTRALQIIHIPVLLVLTVLLGLFGAYGTAATSALCIITQLACCFVPVKRPQGYLDNYEDDARACMLCAIHPNASNWFLYIGDRASIDWLLNKTMIDIDSKLPSPWAKGFRIAHYLQLLAMTFVAGSKGWDGVCLVCLMVINSIFKIMWEFPAHWAALQWISDLNVNISARRFRITGRVPMLGAIQLLSFHGRSHQGVCSHDDAAWMNEILSPSLRRRVWIERLSSIDRPQSNTTAPTLSQDEVALPASDRNWVNRNEAWSRKVYQGIVNGLGKTEV